MLHIDFETKSDVNLLTRGQDCYFASPWADALMASFSFDGKTCGRWLPGEPCPPDIARHVQSSGIIAAHNAAFERGVFRALMTPKYGWPQPANDQFVCSMAAASSMGLPRSLDKLGVALNLPVRKDAAGKELINFFCVPCAYGSDGTPLFNNPKHFPEKFEQFRRYCDLDVLTEAAAYARMFPLSDAEQKVWLLDQTINRRGVRIDRRSVEAAIRLVEQTQKNLDHQMRELTGGEVMRCTEVEKIGAWLETQGVPMAGITKDDVINALNLPGLPGGAKQALLLRQEAAKSSTSKLKAFMRRVSSDDRLRDMFTYHGTGPGRWTSVGVNIANLPRPRPIYADAKLDTGVLFEAFRTAAEREEPGLLSVVYGPELGRPLDLVSDALRGFLWAAPGHDLIAVDYSSIQGRICMWLANEEWKLEAVRRIDADPENEPDLYRRAAAAIMGMTTDIITKKHPLRQSVGKTSELALGFQSGVAGFVAMAQNYNVDLEAMFEPVWGAADEETRERALKRYERCMKARDRVKTDVLSKEAWLACEVTKIKWRQTNPKITEAWSVLEKAARDAVAHPGVQVKALDRVTYLVKHGYLLCRLPSGRCIHYPDPKLKNQVWALLQFDDGSWPEDAEVVERELADRLVAQGRAKIQGETSAKVTVLGVDSQSQKFMRYALYGGLLMENLCLAIERDILVAGMFRVEAADYKICYHVYDELVAEVPHGFGSVEEMVALMCAPLPWTDGLPIAGEGWRGKRYRK